MNARRTFFWRGASGALCAAALLLAGCRGGAAEVGQADPDIGAHRGYSPAENRALPEAPMLAQKVRRGELPPVAERLPVDPMVVPVVEEIGLYGGTWRKFDLAQDFVTVRLLNNYYGLTRWSPGGDEILPGLARSWEVSEDGTRTTFRLRKGVHWSDGAPFTAEDILFWWDLAVDDRFLVAPPEWAFAAGERMQILAPDPYTVVFEYAAPFYFLPLILATGFWTSEEILLPAHYLRQFHPDHNPVYEDFNELDRKRRVENNPDRPGLGPWRMVWYAGAGDRAVFERNPYYWAVDSLGRQLPYIDRIEAIRVQSPEAGVLYVISGNVDAQFRQINLNDAALLKRFSEKEGYRLLTWEEGTATWHTIFVNMEIADPERRALFRNPDFRRALSYALYRERIHQVVWMGLGRPQGAAISDEAWHFRSPRGQEVFRKWITAWSEYDPARADSLLNAAGLGERDEDGFRMYRGKPFRIQLDYREMPYAADQAQLVKQDWEAAGIRTLAKRSPGTDFWSRIDLGQYDMYMEKNSELDLFTFPGVVFPVDAKTWHPRTGRWYRSGGEQGEAPSGFTKQLQALYEEMKREPDLDRRHDLVLDAIEIQLEHGPFMIGTSGRQQALVVVGDHVRNVPDEGPVMGPWAQTQPAASFPEQFFYDANHLYAADAPAQ